MADAKINVVLDTKEAISEAKSFGAQIEKALNINPSTDWLKKQLALLKTNVAEARELAGESNKNLTAWEKSVTTIEKYQDIINKVAELEKRKGVDTAISNNKNGKYSPDAVGTAKTHLAYLGKHAPKVAQYQQKIDAEMAKLPGTLEETKALALAIGGCYRDNSELATKIVTNAEYQEELAKKKLAEQEEMVSKEKEEKTLKEMNAEAAKKAAEMRKQELADVDALIGKQQQLNKEGSSFVPKTKGNATPTPSASTGSPIPNAPAATKTIKDLVSEIALLRNSGQDATDVMEELMTRLRGFNTAAASAGELNKFLGETQEAISYINKDLERPKNLNDVYEGIRAAMAPAKQAMSEFDKEAKRSGNNAAVIAEQQRIAAEQAAEAQRLAEQKAAAEQKRLDREAAAWEKTQQKIRDQDLKAFNHKQAWVMSMIKLGEQLEIEEELQQQAEIQSRQNYLTSIIAVLEQEQAAYQTAVQNILASINQVDSAMHSEKLAGKETVFGNQRAGIVELTRRLETLQQAKKAIEDLGIPPELEAEYGRLSRMIGEITTQINDYKKRTEETGNATNKLGNEGKGVGKAIAQGMKIAKAGLNGIKSVLDTVRKGFNQIAKASSKASSSFNGMSRGMKSNFKHLISNITKYVFGFRSLFFLVRRLRKYLVEGIQDLVRYEKAIGESKALNSTNQAITQLRSSLQYLQHAWSAAFAPIINAITPWLTQLIDMLARAGNTVAKFIGVLTGQKVVYNAIKTPAKDYADSLDKAGNSAGKAAKKQKQLNDRIAAFDDLIILGKDKDKDTTGNGGGSGGNTEDSTDYSKMFKKVKAVSKLATMIKDAIKNGFDFTEVGAYISNGLYTALHNINWPNIKKQAENIGYGIGTFIQGFFKDDKIWSEVGRTIAHGINTATKFVSGFLKGTKGTDLGGGLAKLINKFFTTVNWEEINKNIQEFVRQLVTNLANFLNGISWKDIDKAFASFGQTIGYAISQTLGNPDLMKSLGEALGHLINDIIIAWNELVNSTNGDDIGQSIYEFIKGAIEKVEWDKVAQNLSGSLIIVLDALSKFSEELTKDTSFQKALEDFVGNLNLDSVFEALGRNISSSTAAVHAIGSAIASVLGNGTTAEQVTGGISALIGNLKISDLVGSMVTFIGNLIGAALSDPLLPFKILGAILEGIEKAIGDWIMENNKDAEGNVQWGESMGWFIVGGIVKGIGNAITELFAAVVSPFIAIEDAFCDLFEINSPSKVAEGWGKFIVEGIVNGLSTLIDDVMKPFSDLKNKLEENWGSLKESASTKWEGIKSNVATKAGDIKTNTLEKFNLLKDEIGKVWSSIAGVAYAKWDNIKKILVDAVNAIKDALKTPINGIISIVESMVNKVIGGLNSMFSKLKSLPDFKVTNPFNGKEYNLSLNLPTIKNVSIPRLAQGAVIPPNREFMAVLGDQSHGTNIEAPLDTIKQAVAEVLANNGNAEVIQLLQQLIGVVESKNLVIGDKEIAKANARYTNQQRFIRGASF